MALYSYRALGVDGHPEKGTINAGSEGEAKSMLRARQVYPVELKASQPFRLDAAIKALWPQRGGTTPRQLAAFTRQFATLLRATIPYDTVLGMIIQQTSDLRFKTVLAEVRGQVMEGAYLADAMARFPHYFPHMMVSMARSGESSGNITLIMNRLADYYENLARLRGRITSALVYPIFMMFFGLVVVIFMVTYIIPRITVLLQNFGAELPLPTRILIAVSGLITGYWWLLIALAVAAFVWGARFLRAERGQLLRDRLHLALPVWNLLQRKIILQRFTQTLGTLLQSGVDLKAALAIGAEVMENRVYAAAMRQVIEDVQSKGLPLAVSLRRTNLVPEDVTQMIAIGEETAALDSMLENVSNRLSQEVTATMEAATALFEPVMILMMGGVVGFIVVSILLPLLQMNQLLR
ncbi:MAG: type II secretion system F family protein [Candidatus Lambdaproteobacteria bacterium]|nr:type II secretion system F family protein [Candidatus Lambdaproteobacteria bacterium]